MLLLHECHEFKSIHRIVGILLVLGNPPIQLVDLRLREELPGHNGWQCVHQVINALQQLLRKGAALLRGQVCQAKFLDHHAEAPWNG